MTPTHTRVATGVAMFLFATAALDLSAALAQQAPTSPDATSAMLSTTCGAGTIEKCGDKPVMTCDFSFGVSIDPEKRSFSVNFGRTNCKQTGTVPIYKNMDPNTSVLSGSCHVLNVFLGMPAGSGCSD
jgi:hypothetical protein